MGDEKDEEDEEFLEPEPTTVQLTDEEKKQWFKKQEGTNDLANATFLANFGKFSIPDKEEGFTEVTFEWQKEAAAKEYLNNWVKQRKLTTRVEDLQPSEWFFSRLSDWQRSLQEWQLKQKDYKQDAKNKKDVEKAEKPEKDKEKEDGESKEGDGKEG